MPSNLINNTCSFLDNSTTLSSFTGRLLQNNKTCNKSLISQNIIYVNDIGLTANSIARNIHYTRKWLIDNGLNSTTF